MFVSLSGIRRVLGLATVSPCAVGFTIDVWVHSPEGFFGAGKSARQLAVHSGPPAAEALWRSDGFSNMV
jgi:hypothetical protein